MAITITGSTNAALSALSAYNLHHGGGREAATDPGSTEAEDGSIIYDWTIPNNFEVYCVNTYIPSPPATQRECHANIRPN